VEDALQLIFRTFPQSYTSPSLASSTAMHVKRHGVRNEALAQMPDHCPVWNRDEKSSKFTDLFAE